MYCLDLETVKITTKKKMEIDQWSYDYGYSGTRAWDTERRAWDTEPKKWNTKTSKFEELEEKEKEINKTLIEEILEEGDEDKIEKQIEILLCSAENETKLIIEDFFTELKEKDNILDININKELKEPLKEIIETVRNTYRDIAETVADEADLLTQEQAQKYINEDEDKDENEDENDNKSYRKHSQTKVCGFTD